MDLLLGYCPLYADTLTEDERLFWHDEIERDQAITRLVGQMALWLRNPRAALELRRQAAEWETSPRALLRTRLFPQAVLLTLSEAATPQRMRLGPQWVTDDHGKVQVVPPASSHVPFPDFVRWCFSQVYAVASTMLLDEPYPRRTTQSVRLSLHEEDALERLAVPKSPGARDSAMLTDLLQSDETDLADQLHRLLTVASPRARELFILLRQGLSIKEAASVIGMSPNTAYVHCGRGGRCPSPHGGAARHGPCSGWWARGPW